jgi:hypothetical protein
LKSAPDVLEGLRRHRRVAHCIGDRGMPEEVLEPPCVHSPARQCVSRGMAQQCGHAPALAQRIAGSSQPVGEPRDVKCPVASCPPHQLFAACSRLQLNRTCFRAMSVHFSRDRSKRQIDFLKVLQCLLGDYAGTVPMQTLMQRKHGTQTNDLAHLVGKRLVVASEGEPSAVMFSRLCASMSHC